MKQILKKCLGKKKYQKIFEKLYALSIKGLYKNYYVGNATEAERYAMNLLKTKMSDASSIVVFDVGAHIGTYTDVLYREYLGERGKYFCFEPSSSTFELLKANTSEFKNVNLFNIGFGEKKETLTLYHYNDVNYCSSVYAGEAGGKITSEETIEIGTIDDFCLQNNINHIHFLKIDVEGNEISVLKGAKSMLETNNIDYIQFEFGTSGNINSKTFFWDFYSLLKDNCLVYRMVRDGLYEIKDYNTTKCEVFTTTNFLAINKNQQ